MEEQLSLFPEDVENINTQSGKHYKENCIERAERENVKYNIEQFQIMQKLPYQAKVNHAHNVAKSFYDKIIGEYGANVHVSVGGLDSITLLLFLRSIGIDVPTISVSNLEDVSISALYSLKSSRDVSNYGPILTILCLNHSAALGPFPMLQINSAAGLLHVNLKPAITGKWSKMSKQYKLSVQIL